MAVSEPDIKKLWGLAAGRCSKPGCAKDCIVFVDQNDPTIIGEMAHVIDKQPGGKRSASTGGPDTYDNLILLCPTHHRTVDKAPVGSFPNEMLYEWKALHEESVNKRLSAPTFTNRAQLFGYVQRHLTANHAIWSTYGPESLTAQANPVSSVVHLWTLRKLSEIVPRNAQIVSALEAHAEWLQPDEYRTFRRFAEHAAGFERNAYDPIEDHPRYPPEFEEMIDDGLRIQ